MSIDTGVELNPVVPDTERVAGNKFTDTILLPNPGNTPLEPGSFTVADGITAVLTAYGLGEGEYLTIEKVLMVSGSIGGRVKCVSEVGGTVPARVASVELCGFKLGPCQTIRAISVPGRYRVVDENGYTDGDAMVTIDYVETAIPASLLFGG